MDRFMEHVLDALRNDGQVAVRVFPATSFVVISFAERLANEVVCIHIPGYLPHTINGKFLRLVNILRPF